MSMKFVYFIMMLDNINGLIITCIAVSVFLLITLIVLSLISITYYNATSIYDVGERKFARHMVDNFKIDKKLKYAVFIVIFFATLQTFTPNTKEAVTIYLTAKLANSTTIKNIPPLIEKYITQELQVNIKNISEKR